MGELACTSTQVTALGSAPGVSNSSNSDSKKAISRGKQVALSPAPAVSNDSNFHSKKPIARNSGKQMVLGPAPGVSNTRHSTSKKPISRNNNEATTVDRGQPSSSIPSQTLQDAAAASSSRAP